MKWPHLFIGLLLSTTLIFQACTEDSEVIDVSDPDLEEEVDDQNGSNGNGNNGNNNNDGNTDEDGNLILNLPDNPFNYANIQLPAHYNANNIQNTDNTPNNNQITNEGATLGRVLFYDPLLSANNTTSCASCHLQENSFTDPDQFSQGFEGGLTGRNSMSLANARFYNNGRFFWDERANSLETQTLLPIQDLVEMGLTLEELESKIQAATYYDQLFIDAFGDNEVSSQRIARALSQFIRSMVSFESKYDVGRAQVGNGGGGGGGNNNNFPNFTAQENQGRRLFDQTGCDGCHGTDAFIAPTARNNGLDVVYEDNGVGEVTGNQNDNGDFKVPSLRNVAVTGPYMHDGRFETLMEVVEHYNSGVQPHPNLDNRLRVGGNGGGGGGGGNNGNIQPRRLNLDDDEKEALVAFMETLTDFQFLNDEKYSNPFVDGN